MSTLEQTMNAAGIASSLRGGGELEGSSFKGTCRRSSLHVEGEVSENGVTLKISWLTVEEARSLLMRLSGGG